MSNSFLDSDTLNQAFDRYERMKMLEKLGSVAEDRYFRNPLDEEEQKLSILQKKKSLGLPMDSSDYEDATNNDKSFFSTIAPSLKKRGIQAIPGPSPFDGVKHDPVFKVATFVDRLLPSVEKSSTKISKGAYYGGAKLPGLARYFLNL